MRLFWTGSESWTSVLIILLAAGVACAQERPGTIGTQTKAGGTMQAAGPAVKGDMPQEDQLIRSLRSSFQKKNPKLTQVGVLDLRAWDFLGPRLVLGWAIVGDKVFSGDFNDEMFGVFVVNESLTRVERVVETFPTRSWFDYEVRFGKFTADSVEVVGRGSTHGDDPTRRVYKWR